MGMSEESQQSVLLTHDRGTTRVLTLNRPRVKNAFNTALYGALAEAIRHSGEAGPVHCVILTGNGNVFCAGQDLSEALEIDQGDDDRADHNLVVQALSDCPKPVIAAVNGAAVGFGATMLLHCDLILAAQSARFRFPFVSLGIAPEAGATYLLPRAVGAQNAFSWFTTGSWIGAEEAVAAGFALATYPDDGLLSEAIRIADEIGKQPLPGVTATKQLMAASRREDLHAALDRERQVQEALLTQGEYRSRFAAAVGDKRSVAGA